MHMMPRRPGNDTTLQGQWITVPEVGQWARCEAAILQNTVPAGACETQPVAKAPSDQQPDKYSLYVLSLEGLGDEHEECSWLNPPQYTQLTPPWKCGWGVGLTRLDWGMLDPTRQQSKRLPLA